MVLLFCTVQNFPGAVERLRIYMLVSSRFRLYIYLACFAYQIHKLHCPSLVYHAFFRSVPDKLQPYKTKERSKEKNHCFRQTIRFRDRDLNYYTDRKGSRENCKWCGSVKSNSTRFCYNKKAPKEFFFLTEMAKERKKNRPTATKAF